MIYARIESDAALLRYTRYRKQASKYTADPLKYLELINRVASRIESKFYNREEPETFKYMTHCPKVDERTFLRLLALLMECKKADFIEKEKSYISSFNCIEKEYYRSIFTSAEKLIENIYKWIDQGNVYANFLSRRGEA